MYFLNQVSCFEVSSVWFAFFILQHIHMIYIYIYICCIYIYMLLCVYIYIYTLRIYIYYTCINIYIYRLPYITHMCIHMLYLYILDTNGLHSSFAEGLVFHLFIYFLLVSLSLCVSIHVYTYPDAPCSMVLEYLPLLPMHLPQIWPFLG